MEGKNDHKTQNAALKEDKLLVKTVEKRTCKAVQTFGFI